MLASRRRCLSFATSRLWLRHRRQLYLHKTTSNFSCHMHYVYTHAFTLHPSFCVPPHCFFIPISSSNYVLVYCQHATPGVLINILTLSRNYSFVLSTWYIILYIWFLPFYNYCVKSFSEWVEGSAKWSRVCAKVDGSTGVWEGGHSKSIPRVKHGCGSCWVGRNDDGATVKLRVVQHYCTTRAIINTIHDGNKQE